MSIILRTLKGSALTYEEMDRNLSQYFYSSSVHDSGTELRLHYTGSDGLDTATEDYGPTRYQSVTLGSGGSGGVTRIIAGTGVSISPVSGVGSVTINASGAAGNNPGGSVGSIQFQQDSTTFGGNTDLFYQSDSQLVGLGTNSPDNKLHIVGSDTTSATIKIATSGGGTTERKAQLTFFDGTTQLGYLGKTVGGSASTSNQIFLGATNKLNFDVNSSTIASVSSVGLGIFDTTPNRQLVVLGTDGIGVQKGGTRSTQSIIRPIVSGVYSSGILGSGANEYGLMLSSPLTSVNGVGGHVVVSLSEAGSRSPSAAYNSFSIISSTNEAYASALSVASFTSNQRAGIATNNPQVTLDVNGQIRGKYTANASDTTALGLYTSRVVKAPITGDITFTATVAPAGTEGIVIIVPSIVSTNTVTFSSSNFKTEGTLTVSKSRTYTVSFVSDGSYWYETSRTGDLS
jgi:hypothetical protein